MFRIQPKKKTNTKRQIAVNTPMYIKERFKASRDICQSTFKVTGQTPGLFGYCSSVSTLIPYSGPNSAFEISKEPLMSNSLLCWEDVNYCSMSWHASLPQGMSHNMLRAPGARK